MKKLLIALALLIASNFSYAVLPLPANLINLASPAGATLLMPNLNVNTLKLLSHFTTQKTVSFCGVASVVMVLNSSLLDPPIDSLHAPYHYLNQDDFFNDKVINIVKLQEVQKHGMTLATLNRVIQSFGLGSKLYYASNLDEKKFKKILITAIANNQFIIVNFLRSSLHEKGGGHHSPLAAYNEKTDRFLLLDVARYKYPAYWVKAEDLWKAVNTMDKTTSRGIIIISQPVLVQKK